MTRTKDVQGMRTKDVRGMRTRDVRSETRVGVFVCHCGTNIGGFLDVSEVTEYARSLPHVVFAQDNLYTCSDGGLTEIKEAIEEQRLNRVVVASCTPRTHEPLFRNACREAGLNPYLFEFVNIRDQCSWVHMRERERATQKAKDLVRMGVVKAALLEPKEEIEVEVTPVALVIGAGISGMTAALALADRGFEVKLIEKEKEIGGMVRNLHRLYPTDVDGTFFMRRKIRAITEHPKIALFAPAQLKDVRGFIGNYDVVVERGGEEISFNVGVIIVATGAEVFVPQGWYGYDGNRVITQHELDRMLKEDRFHADRVVMIQCVGTRTEERPYCSRICCIIALKNAMMIKEAHPGAQVFVLYRDLQTYGVEYEEYLDEARRSGIVFVRYSADDPPVVEGGGVRVTSPLLGEALRIPYDYVVLASPLVARSDSRELAQMLKVPQDRYGFFLEAHVKLRPVDFATDGIYLCGCAHWPAHIGESISQAYAAASRASIPLTRGYVRVEPITAVADRDRCIGCGLCESVCPYGAMHMMDTDGGRKAENIPASCKGCGACGAGCPAKAIIMQHFTDDQIFAQIDALAEAV